MDIAKIRKKLKEEKKDAAEKEMPKEESRKEPAAPEEPEPPELKEEGVPERTMEKAEEPADAVPAKPPVELPEKKDTGEIVAVDGLVELLTYQLSGEEFAFRVSDIEEILRYQRITVVPRMPGYILGITSLRGKIIPVVDLGKRLSIKNGAEVDQVRQKILILKGSRGPFGALIDRVKGVIRISPSEIAEPPSHLTESELLFMEGVVLHNSRFISVIRVEEVMDLNIKLKLKE